MIQTKANFLQNNLFFAEVKKLLQDQKSVRIRVRGSSMLPFIRHNDAALLVPPTSRKIRKGSVVIALTDELGYVMHRICKIEGEHITLLGDGNTNQYEHSDLDRIIAVAVRYDRGRFSYSTESWFMRIVGLLWMKMHPWRKNLVSVLWRVKTKLFK